MRLTNFAFVLLTLTSFNSFADRQIGDPYTYNPEFLNSQDSACKSSDGHLKDFYVSYEKVVSSDRVVGLALLVNYTSKMGIHDVICKSARTRVQYNSRLNTLDIIAIDQQNAFNWNSFRQDGGAAKAEVYKLASQSYLPIESLPMYQSLKVRILDNGALRDVLLFNDPRNFLLYVFEDLFTWRDNRRAPLQQAILKDIFTYARGTDEESLERKVYYPKVDGTKVEIKY